MDAQLRGLLATQRLVVLATQSGEQPYCSLVAFARGAPEPIRIEERQSRSLDLLVARRLGSRTGIVKQARVAVAAVWLAGRPLRGDWQGVEAGAVGSGQRGGDTGCLPNQVLTS